MGSKDMSAQPPGIGVADVVNPALHAGIQFGKCDLPGGVQVEVMLQEAGKVHGVEIG